MQRGLSLAVESGDSASKFDDDGRTKRTGISFSLSSLVVFPGFHLFLFGMVLVFEGTLFSASAHIITAVIGSGVLSLAWAIAQLGWVAGILALIIFSLITLFTSTLLADSYRSPDSVSGKRNYSYIEAVKSNLGEGKYQFCGIAQYSNLVGTTIGYIITTAISMAAVKRSHCFHKNGHGAGCHTTNNIYMTCAAIIQIFLSQIPNFHDLAGLSYVAAIMSFTYASIGIGLATAQIAEGKAGKTSITGVKAGVAISSSQKVWNSLQALGNIAFAYSYSQVLIEIQDTLKSSPPENAVMKKATSIAVSVTSVFYLLCGVLGYAAFGNDAPGNFLTGFGFFEPYWLIDITNICIVVHLVGAYQVFCQPIFQLVEGWSSSRWPGCDFIVKERPILIPYIGIYNINFFRLIWRTLYVMFTSVIAMLFPVFNSVLGLIGAISFWPLTVYFPVEMHIAQANIRKFSPTWIGLNILSLGCLIITLAAASASIEGIINDTSHYKPFNSVS